MKHIGQLEQYEQYIRRKRLVLLLAGVLTLLTALLYLGIGSMKIPLREILRAFAGTAEQKYLTTIRNIRLPRVLAAVLVGATLASSGAVMQCILRNPLASASTLGVSQGAAFGAAIGIIVFGGGAVTSSTAASTVSVNNPYLVTLCAFVCGSVSSLVILGVSRLKRNAGAGTLILAGTALSSMFSGGTTLVQYFADDVMVATVVHWTFGSLSRAGWNEIKLIGALALLAFLFFYVHRWNYNAMESGPHTAKSLGVPVDFLIPASMIVCALISSVSVAFVGCINFIGLIAAHIMRRFVGNDFRFLIPCTALCGACLLLLSDIACRMLVSPVVLPIGALTSFLGAPLFLILVMRRGSVR